MKILFTTGNNLLSWIIRKITREECSHVVMQFGELVVHSDLLGVRVERLDKFMERTRIIHSLDWDDSLNTHLLYHVLTKHLGKGYDIGAFIYLGLRLMCRCFPKVNLWQTSGMFLCTEFVTEVISQEEDSMITPCKLYEKLKKELSNVN